MYFLGAHILGHDLSCSLVDSEGRIVFVAEQERYSKVKGGEFVFHPRLLKQILTRFGIDFSMITHMAIVGGDGFDYGGYQQNLAYDLDARKRHFNYWEMRYKSEFASVGTVLHYGHHQCHAASAYYFSGLGDSYIYAVDGYGEAVCESIWKGTGNRVELIQEVSFPNSIAYLYRAFATWLNIEGWEREGKLMALAAYGTPKYQAEIQKYLCCTDGEFRIDKRFLGSRCKYYIWSNIIGSVFGPGRIDGEELSIFHYDVAASIQKVLEDYILNRVEWIRCQFGANKLVFAGGAFLNSKMVGRLRRESGLIDFWVQPLSSDSGLSLGASALLASHFDVHLCPMEHLYLGESISYQELEQYKDIFQKLENPELWVAHQISDGKVVALCGGRMEVGPRSLGNRSILADATSSRSVHRVNALKRREQWRPFAPAIREEDVNEFVDNAILNPFMTEVQLLKLPELLPSVAHCDGTSRIQAVDGVHNKSLHMILTALKLMSGLGVVLNTSLNVQGMPIARDLDDVLEFYKSTAIDEVVINGYRICAPREHAAVEAELNLPIERLNSATLIQIGNITRFQQAVVPLDVNIIKVDLCVVLDASWMTRLISKIQSDVVLVVLPWYVRSLSVAAPTLANNMLVLIEADFDLYLMSPDGYVCRAQNIDWVKDQTLIRVELGDFEDHVAKMMSHLNR